MARLVAKRLLGGLIRLQQVARGLGALGADDERSG
jgi:hypothetical protein